MTDHDLTSEPGTRPPDIGEEDRLLAFADRLRRGDEDAKEREETPETWVAFQLSGRTYALPVTHVFEFAEVGAITQVPGAPPAVCGVASLRGHAIPIVDLEEHLGLSRAGGKRHQRALIVDHRGRRVGLLVDAVDRVFKLLPSLVQPVPPSDSHDEQERLTGFYESGGEQYALLNADNFLAHSGDPRS